MRADSSVTMPLPDNAPDSAEALRPWLANVICIARGRRASSAPDNATPNHRRPRAATRAFSAMPFAARLGIELAVASPPPMPALIASKVSDWPSLLTMPLIGRNSAPPGSAPRNA